MAIVIATLSFICAHMHGWHQCGTHYYDQQLHGLSDWLPVICVIAFFTGFLPAYIYESIKAMRPVEITASQAMTQPLYVGQVFTATGSNCKVRIKALHTPVNIAA